MKLSKRPENITFSRFQCNIDGIAMDKRIKEAGSLSFPFCLRLPRHIYSVYTDDVTLVNSTVMSPLLQAKYTTPPSSPVCSLFGSGDDNQSTPNQKSTPDLATNLITSPRMWSFMNSSKGNSKEKYVFYGDLSFMDSQGIFASTFRKSAIIFPSNLSTLDSSGVTKNKRP